MEELNFCQCCISIPTLCTSCTCSDERQWIVPSHSQTAVTLYHSSSGKSRSDHSYLNCWTFSIQIRTSPSSYDNCNNFLPQICYRQLFSVRIISVSLFQSNWTIVECKNFFLRFTFIHIFLSSEGFILLTSVKQSVFVSYYSFKSRCWSHLKSFSFQQSNNKFLNKGEQCQY